MIQYHEAKKDAQAAVALRIVKQFRELPVVGNPSFISPYWIVRSSEIFEEAPSANESAQSSGVMGTPEVLFLNE
jgi:hypothetical protein